MLINEITTGTGTGSKPEWYDRAVQMKLDNPSISFREIARQIGITQNTVNYWLTGYKSPGQAINLKRPSDSFPFKREDFPHVGSKKYFDGAKPKWYNQALQMAKAGETFDAIAKKVGTSNNEVGRWLVKGRKNHGKIVNPDAELEPRAIKYPKLNLNMLNNLVADKDLDDRDIIELIAVEYGKKAASTVKTMLPVLRQKLNPGTQVIDKSRTGSMRDPDITGLVQ